PAIPDRERASQPPPLDVLPRPEPPLNKGVTGHPRHTNMQPHGLRFGRRSFSLQPPRMEMRMSKAKRNPVSNCRWAFPILALAALAGPASAETLDLAMEAHKGYFSERCIDLGKGQRLSYQLRTPYAVDFNLHHHPGSGETVFPERLLLTAPHYN